MKFVRCLVPCLFVGVAVAGEPLDPIMVVPNGIVMHEHYDDESKELLAEIEDRRKGAWLIKSGHAAYDQKALKLTPPTEAEAAAKEKVNATHTRVFIREAPANNVISFRFKLIGTPGERRPPRFFYENGHYKIRISGGADGVKMTLGKTDKATSDFKIEADKWYEAMLEVHGDEAVARFAGGPTLYVKDEAVKQERIGVQLLALGKGGIVMDDVKIQSVAAEQAAGWTKLRETQNAEK